MKYEIPSWTPLLLSLLFSSSGFAVTAPDYMKEHPRMEFTHTQSPRLYPDLRFTVPPSSRQALTQFLTSPEIEESLRSGSWKILWDHQTGVPSRIFGVGLEAPHSLASAATAQTDAHAFLERHITLLAPGALKSDFQAVTNEVHDGIRMVGFKQFKGGLPVEGGQISFRYKNDRLFVIASESLPHVKPPKVQHSYLPKSDYQHQARLWIHRDFPNSSPQVSNPTDPVILPLIPTKGDTIYQTVVPTVVSTAHPVGKWTVYLDAETGLPVARRQELHFFETHLKINTPDRWPGRGRETAAATFLSFSADEWDYLTDEEGKITWEEGTESITTNLQLKGERVKIHNRSGDLLEEPVTITHQQEFVWDHQDDERADAQLSAYVYANRVRDYVTEFATDMAWLKTDKVQVYVNIDEGECNAYSDGTTINFLAANRWCENTARLSDVVYHEFGHSFHAHALVWSVGAWDTALSEGASDYLSATINNDPAMGIGFFGNESPLRHLNDRDRRWPDDISEEHETGIIFGGAMWDLRTNLIASLGRSEGIEKSDRLYYQALKTSSNIPTTYVELLAADDDDGDLSNGTPNICEINEAFSRHGLGEPAGFYGISKPIVAGTAVMVNQDTEKSCPGAEVASVTLHWEHAYQPSIAGTIDMEQGPQGFKTHLPPADPGVVVNYQVEVVFGDGTVAAFPENEADPWYQHFNGEVIPLYCTGFETMEELVGWNHELLSGDEREGANDWQFGSPISSPGSGDPKSAFGGTNVFGNDLGGGEYNGMYQPDKVNTLKSPVINTQGYKHVRLQYRRWLNIEDGFYDQATIYSNEHQVWQNHDSGDGGKVHHQDKEWRFHDVNLSHTIEADQVQLRFELTSDGGMEFGGWTLDDFCVVALDPVQPGDPCTDCDIEPSEGCAGCNNGGSETSFAFILSFLILFFRRHRYPHLSA